MASGIVWDDRSLFGNIETFPAKLEAAMFAFTEMQSPKVAGYAKQNATWVDRTGNARQGLATVTEHGDGKHSIVLFHRMPYGIWLETRWSGRYAIILPTIRVKGREIMAELNTLFRRLG